MFSRRGIFCYCYIHSGSLNRLYRLLSKLVTNIIIRTLNVKYNLPCIWPIFRLFESFVIFYAKVICRP